jgi:hypothetical protein
MQAEPRWTPPRDAWLCRLRLEGATWAEIAAELGVTLDMARERGRKLRARRPPPGAPVRTEDPDRPSLPPGHPRSWGLLTAGTLLESSPWPGWAKEESPQVDAPLAGEAINEDGI